MIFFSNRNKYTLLHFCTFHTFHTFILFLSFFLSSFVLFFLAFFLHLLLSFNQPATLSHILQYDRSKLTHAVQIYIKLLDFTFSGLAKSVPQSLACQAHNVENDISKQCIDADIVQEARQGGLSIFVSIICHCTPLLLPCRRISSCYTSYSLRWTCTVSLTLLQQHGMVR